MLAEARKRCGGCGKDKPRSSFSRESRSSDGLQSYCKACAAASRRNYVRRVGKSLLNRRDRYGLTLNEVRLFMEIPVCQACGTRLDGSHASKFDHCHSGGHMRGVLCHPCNLACSGRSSDAITRLYACIDYLKRDLERIGES